jgi:hypothetical protein
MAVFVSFKISCDYCHKTIEEMWETDFYSDVYVSEPNGWKYVDTKGENHPLWGEQYLCPDCIELAKTDKL